MPTFNDLWDCTVQSQPEHDVIVARNVTIPTRDGVSLAADISFPAASCDRVPGSFPVILVRTPYDKSSQSGIAEHYARRGYVFVAQDVRGRYASEGRFFAFADEGEDGFDTVEWIARQPWSNGRIGTMGASYCAAAQSALACFDPPHLAAMIVTFGPSSYFHSSMRHNGVLELRFLVYAFTMAATSREAAADACIRAALQEAAAHVWDYIGQGPIRPGTTPLALTPDYERWAVAISTHGCYDDFWRRPGFGPLAHYEAHADVPTLYVGGWYDTYTRGTIENFTALSQNRTDRVHLLMGPWHHGGVGACEAGDAVFAPCARIPYERVRLQWFDHWLKDMPTGLDRQSPVTYFMMGTEARNAPPTEPLNMGGEWRRATQWPPREACETRYFLRSEGRLSRDVPAADDSPASLYSFDPANPVRTIGGNLSAMPLPPGPFDQRADHRFGADPEGLPLACRRDILVFSTPPLDSAVEVAGSVTARLYVATDGPDTDFTVKLIDVFPPSAGYPAGAAVNITDSIARLRFRNSLEREELVQPGTIVEMTFSLYPTAHRFETGHRIRIDISSSNYPRFELNDNTGGPIGNGRRHRIAQNSVCHSPEHPSAILLSTV